MPQPPIPRDQQVAARWSHTRLRRRMLYGGWIGDLRQRVLEKVGKVRSSAWRTPDLSGNIFRSSMQQLAVLYATAPTVSHDAAEAATVVAAVKKAKHWALMQRIQRDTLGMREMFLRLDCVRGELAIRPAFPDLIDAQADPDFPDRPIYLREAILRRDPDTKELVWTYDELDLRAEPAWRVVKADKDEVDLSKTFLVDADGRPAPEGGFRGDRYPFRFADGAPFINYTQIHAAATGQLFDPYEGVELVEGALNLGVHWTMFGHCVLNASWPQRYTANARIVAKNIEGEVSDTNRASIVTDPAVVLELESDPEGTGQPMIGQWAPSANPAELEDAISRYERRLAAFAGINPADVQRVAGDPRSGFALAITREAQREAQRFFEPQFRLGDEDVLAKSAALLNRSAGAKTLPEDGYRLAYEAIPLSAQELDARRRDIVERIDAGLLDIVTAYQLEHPGASKADAEKALQEIERINRQFRPQRATAA